MKANTGSPTGEGEVRMPAAAGRHTLRKRQSSRPSIGDGSVEIATARLSRRLKTAAVTALHMRAAGTQQQQQVHGLGSEVPCAPS
eukprot:7382556-Prymnesium_polylepis.1